MSANCLVTRLKAVVNNDELPILGAIKFYIGAGEGGFSFEPVSGKSITIKTADGSAKIAKSSEDMDSGSFVSSVDITVRTRLYFKNPNCYFLISEKENLLRFGYTSDNLLDNITIDLSEFAYATSLGSIRIGTTSYETSSIIKGDINNLQNTNLNIKNGITFAGVTFVDDADFNKFGLIKSLENEMNFGQGFRRTNLKGSIEGVIANYRKTHEITSGSVTFSNMFSAERTMITFNGEKINASTSGSTWTWTANSKNTKHTDITSPDSSTTITIDADGKVVS